MEMRLLSGFALSLLAGCYQVEPRPPYGAGFEGIGCALEPELVAEVENPTPRGLELHVFGVATSYSSNQPTWGETQVYVDRSGPVALVLSSWGAVHWRLHVEPDTDLTRVIINGYDRQEVTAPPGVYVENRSPFDDSLGWVGMGDDNLADVDGPDDTPKLIAAAEAEGLAAQATRGAASTRS